MRPWTTALGTALLLAGMTVGSAFAWPDRLAGRPEQFEAGGDSAYYIWTDDNDIHLSTTGHAGPREFRAVIRTDGEIQNVDQLRLEEGDGYDLRDDGHTLVVVFHTVDRTDNVRWRVNGGTFMHFDLNVDGHSIRPDNIYLGHDGVHPFTPDFRVRR